ncbi:MAG: ADP-ribosylglycohydrolase family protein, partial [Myxococcota bacterium]|nr:ADP-ribosylglycohydrolase family protein [Myxococcota bacterium]
MPALVRAPVTRTSHGTGAPSPPRADRSGAPGRPLLAPSPRPEGQDPHHNRPQPGVATTHYRRRHPDQIPIRPWVVTSVAWSLYSFLKTPWDFEETIYTAICCGGDVDTTAAMTGAIGGVYHGDHGIDSGRVEGWQR